MKLGTSPITNTIFAGNTRKLKDGNEVWTKKTEVTDSAVASVYEWFINNSKNEGDTIYQIRFKGFGTLSYDPKGKFESEVVDETK